jgi:hypothetical protein
MPRVTQVFMLEDAYLLFDLKISFARSISRVYRLPVGLVLYRLLRRDPLRYRDLEGEKEWYGVSRERERVV